jgi:hypothetical protein
MGTPASEAGEPDERAHVWVDVEAGRVLEVLARYAAHPENPAGMNTALLSNYIRSRNDDDELVRWTVALAGGVGGQITVGGQRLRAARRTPPRRPQEGDRKVTLNGLTSPLHEALDLSEEEKEAALKASIEAWEEEQRRGEGRGRRREPPRIPYPRDIRARRPRERGLLLVYTIDPAASEWSTTTTLPSPVIGLGLSFPPSKQATERPIHYMVNKRYVDEWI